MSAEGFETGAVSLDEICVLDTSLSLNCYHLIPESGTLNVRTYKTTGTIPVARDCHSTTLIHIQNTPVLLLLFGSDADFKYLGLILF